MKFSIFTKTQKVIVDGVVQSFDFSGLIAEDIWAVIWDTDSGTIEYNNLKPSETINDFTDFLPIITEYTERDNTVVTAAEIKIDVVAIEYLSGRAETTTKIDAQNRNITFIEMPLIDKQAEKRFEIEQKRNEAIEQPVVSDALGSAHTYAAKSENRQFLNDLITLGLDSKFTCVDQSGIKARILHTNAQLLVLAADIQTAISNHFNYYETLLNQIENADSNTDFSAIQW